MNLKNTYAIEKPGSGLILLDKPKGLSSQTAVTLTKRIIGVKTAGHAGTLDPLATGLLVICFGRATRACQYLLEQDKRYSILLKIGIETDTGDITGKIVSTSSVKPSLLQMNKTLTEFIGIQKQKPPVFSAIHINGKRAYDIARKGLNVEMPEREIEIHKLNITHADEVKGLFKLDILCSKGTYIRSLCRDIAKKAGSRGTMLELRRISTGKFSLENGVSLEAIREKVKKNDYNFIIPTDMVFLDMPAVIADITAEQMIRNGVLVPKHLVYPEENEYRGDKEKFARIYSKKGDFLSVSKLENDFWKCEKSFFEVS